MKTLALTILVATFALPSAAALALDDATKAAATICQDPKSAPEKGIDACTTVLSNVKMGPKNTMAIHYYRGAFYVTSGKNDKAAIDFTDAVNAYEQDADKANWTVDFIGLAASAYNFRAQIEEASRKCDAARTDYQTAAATEREVSEREQYEKAARNTCK